MRGNKWFILLASLALVLLASSMGVTRSFFVDLESSTGNTFQAWASGEWVQTTQADFEAGVLTNTVDVQIGANNRDAWDDASSGSLDLCYFGDADWWDAGGYQWSLSIPQGATIDVAYISVYPTWHGGATGAYIARIRVEDVDNPAAFTGAPNNIRGRTYWTTTVDWPIPAGGLPLDQWNDSPSIKDLVQHAVNSPGWSEGDYISIAIWGQTGNGGCGEGVNDFSSDPSYAARLYVEYRTVDTTTSPGDVMLATLSDWWDMSWGCRAPITINNAGSSLTDYQVKVDVTYDADMKSDFSDIRFVDSDGSTLLSHWRESYIASTSATFWVKIPSIPSGNKTIYMYYGNAGASSASDGDAAFEFFDDFEDGDISDWSQYGSGTVQIANDGGNYVLLKTDSNDPNGGYSLFNNGALSNFEAVFRTKRINENGGPQNRYGIENGSFNGYGPRMADFNSLPSAFAIERRTGGGGSNLVSKNTSAYQWDTWMTVKFRRYGNTLEFELYDSSGSLVESISTSNSLYNSFDRFVVHGGYQFYTDDIRVRQYASPEPTASVGSEEGIYVSSGTIASQVWDTGVDGAGWDGLFWDEILPSGTDITFEVRASDTLFAKDAPDATLPWMPVGGTSPVTSGLPSGRYMQWRATLTTSATSETPVLQEVRVYYY